MEAVYIFIFIILALLKIAFDKKDSTLIFFAGFLLSFFGINTFQNGFANLNVSVSQNLREGY